MREMKEHQFYIYKYVCNDETIYIGKSTDIVRRINEHARCKGADKKFTSFVNKSRIYVHRCSTENEMNSLESIFIDLYKPILNDAGKSEIRSTITRDDFIVWAPYNERGFMDPNTKTQKTKNTKQNKMTQQEKLLLRKKQICAAEMQLSYFKKAVYNLIRSVDIKKNEHELLYSQVDYPERLTTGVSYNVDGYGFMSVNPPFQLRINRSTGQNYLYFELASVISWMSDSLKWYETNLLEIKQIIEGIALHK